MAKSHTRRRKNISLRRKRGGAAPVPTFHFLLTSGGRPSIKTMLDSLKGELKDGDAVTLVFDGEQAVKESGYTTEWKEEFNGRLHIIVEKEKTGNWGHGLRTKYQGQLQPRTTFVLHGDDDDGYIPGFLEKLRNKCTNPDTLYIAKMNFKYETVPNEVIPKGNKIEADDIGTPNGIIPYDLAGKSEWLPNYRGDFIYYERISKQAKAIEFIPDIIYTVMTRVQDKPSRLIFIFYHIYCNEYTLPIVKDQITKIIFSGLYENVKGIKCFMAGTKAHMQPIRDFLNNSGSKFTIEAVGENDSSFERFTLEKIPKYITSKDLFLYIHTKGVSPKHASTENAYWWRTWMEYNLIYRFKECLEALQTFNIVGVGYTTKMIGPHFSGNFWWTNGSYFDTLPKKPDGTLNIGNGYTDPENYIFKGKDPKHLDIDEGRAEHPDIDYFTMKPGIRAANRPPKPVTKGGRRRTR
jgi:hypothetical protein